MRGSTLCVAALSLAGCGGAGLSPTGRLAVRVAWPEKTASRVIPAAAQSVLVQVLQGATVVNSTILTAATPRTIFPDVPTGTLTITAVAYPTTNATGTAMAAGQTTQAVTTGSTPTVDLTMASTIDHLAISPSPIALALTGIFTRQIAVTAFDAGNAVVLTAPTDLSYTTTNSLLFDVSATGLVRGLAVGAATVKATDATSGKWATAPVAVTLY